MAGAEESKEDKAAVNPPTSEETEDMPPAYDETSGLTVGDVPEVKIAPSETKIDMGGKGEKKEDGFQGLTKEELMKYANDPFWVRLRWTLFILFWVVWVAMLVASVVIIVYAPKCPSPEPKSWWQKSPIYKVDLDEFPAPDGSTPSTLQDLTSSLDYLVKAGVGTLYLTSFYPSSSSDLTAMQGVEAKYGNMADWTALVAGLNERYQHVVLDFVPNEEVLRFWLDNGVDGFMVNDLPANLGEFRALLDQESETSGSPKVLIGDLNVGSQLDSTADSPLHLDFTPNTFSHLTLETLTAPALKDTLLDYVAQSITWPSISLTPPSTDLVDPLTMFKMLLPATSLYKAGEELGLTALNWEAVTEQEAATQSHLNLFSTLANKLRHQDAILFGDLNVNTTVVLNETVFGMTRVKKGNPGYLLAINFGAEDLVVDFSAMENVPPTIRVMARSTQTISEEETGEPEVRTYKSEAVPVKPNEGKIFTFVPKFGD